MSDQRYLVTARKYRPTLFKELVAQEHVTETLKNAIRLDRLAHAYLFSGPRGVGKTTAARILATAINCTTLLEEREDQAEPCRTCNSCLSFEEGRNLSIFEIDAASNNKVEDIRDLRETVRIPPQGSRKKVYIIDEVHMLSNAAFNALLKTLEEPPPHVLFIFATTEPHKVLPTILSRCQRFDFRRIPVPDIVARLEEICTEESITADEASLMLVARKGDGALRDALSAFDQAVALCGTDLQYTDLAEALRVVDVDLFFTVTQHVLDRSSAGMLHLVGEIMQSGYDLQEFLVGLAEHLRNLLVARTMEDTALIEAAEATRQRYGTTATHFSESDLLRLLMIVDEAQESIKSSTQPRMKLEMALLKMASLAHAADLRTALQQLDRLEKMAREGKLP
ncbi:MAG TPA: DNA polymerase III subunit gamma/tau, partial [Rhodothermales bacterium]|nr:DNA polymerase III subunit gamma/tau [Rhodothermales bacterium]